MTDIINETLDNLTTSFSEFKSFQGQRLDQVDTFIENANQRIEKMELSLQRPGFSEATETKSRSFPEFSGFVRKGTENNFKTKALTSETPERGGYLIPQPIVRLINQSLSGLSFIRQLASNTTINSDSLDLLLEKKETEAGWVAEIEERKETQTPELAKIHIPVHQIYAKPRVSQKMLDDSSINIEEWISGKIANKFSNIENIGFLHGDGKNKPQGILTAPTCDLFEEEWGKVSTLVTDGGNNFASPDQLLEVVYSLKAKYLAGAVWIMPRSVAVQVARIKDTQDRYMWQQSLISSQPNTLLGYPVYICDDMVKDKEPPRIIFGNIKEAYHVVDRANMSMLRDPFSAKPYVEFYATKRVGGAIVNHDAIKYVDLSEKK